MQRISGNEQGNIPINNDKQSEENRKSTIGDIDELIFPDDEPYYISQR